MEMEDEEKLRGAELMVLMNNPRVDRGKYTGDSMIVKESRLEWIAIPAYDIVHNFKVMQETIEADDNLLISLSGVTEVEAEFISIQEGRPGTRTWNLYTRMIVDFSISRDIRHYDRSVFTFWEVLGEVGGLQGFLAPLFGFVLSILTFQKPDNFLAAELYKEGG